MKETGLLFKAEMVRAILDDRKTMTRRMIRPKLHQNGYFAHGNDIEVAHKNIREWREQNGTWYGLAGWNTLAYCKCPFGKVGDIIYVRETYGKLFNSVEDNEPIFYRADYSAHELETQVLPKWKPSIFMPRWASRIKLEITDVRVERLTSISEEDAIKEGLRSVIGPLQTSMWEYSETTGGQFADPRVAYQMLWEQINGLGSWDKNPWVWVITFEKI